MPRGTGMPPTRRRHRRLKHESPEALAARIPGELRSLEDLSTPSDYLLRRRQVAEWLNQAAPGKGVDLTGSVMTAAGLEPAEFYRKVLA